MDGPDTARSAGHPIRWRRPRARRVLVLAALLVLGTLVAWVVGPLQHAFRTGAAGAPAESGVGTRLVPVAERQQLPEIVGTDLAGKPLALRDLVGSSVLVINVWASWCYPCRQESAALADLLKATNPHMVTFVGIDEHDDAGAARSFVRSSGTAYRHLRDPAGAALRKLTMLPSVGIPSTLLVDRNGLMAARVIGPVHASSLRELIDRVGAE